MPAPRSERPGTDPPPANGPAGGPRAQGRRISLTGRAAVLTLVLAALVVAYASSVRTWVEQRSEIGALQSQLHDQRRQVRELEQTIRRWQDPAYVETQARERLGWVLPGEVGYVVVGADGRPVATAAGGQGGSSAGRDGGARPWWEALWGSVERAGRPPTNTRAEDRGPTPAATIDPRTTPGPGR